MCRERTISRVGILLNEGGAVAVRMPQIRRRRPTGLSVGVNLYLSQKLVSALIVGREDFISTFIPFLFIVATFDLNPCPIKAIKIKNKLMPTILVVDFF